MRVPILLILLLSVSCGDYGFLDLCHNNENDYNSLPNIILNSLDECNTCDEVKSDRN